MKMKLLRIQYLIERVASPQYVTFPAIVYLKREICLRTRWLKKASTDAENGCNLINPNCLLEV
jgi:hypothetical protein